MPPTEIRPEVLDNLRQTLQELDAPPCQTLKTLMQITVQDAREREEGLRRKLLQAQSRVLELEDELAEAHARTRNLEDEYAEICRDRCPVIPVAGDEE